MPILILNYEHKINNKNLKIIFSLVECPECYKQRSITKSSALIGYGKTNNICKKCSEKYLDLGREFRHKNIKLQKEDYLLIAEKEYLVCLEIPENSSHKTTWKCKKCEYLWNTTYSKIQQGRKCPKCIGRLIIKHEKDYIELANLMEIKFLGPVPELSKAKTNWLCKCGKTFLMDFSHVKRGQTCSECGSKKNTGDKHFNWNPNKKEMKLNKKLRSMIGNMVNNFFKKVKFTKKNKSEFIIGYKKEDLKSHLESKFESWMNWENYGHSYKIGEEKKWSIDHIKPVIQFIKEGIIDAKIIHALSNLRPFDANDNLKRAI